MFTNSPEKLDCKKEKTVYISTNGVHLDVIIPRIYLNRSLLRQLGVSSQTTYLSFGWGDKGFYLETPRWKDLKFTTAVKALFWKSETAVHLTKYRRKASHWKPVYLCNEQFTDLMAFIDGYFEKDENDRVIEIKDSGYTNSDTFFEATGNYNMIMTCNQWVNNALKAANVETSIWSPLDNGVLYHVTKTQ